MAAVDQLRAIQNMLRGLTEAINEIESAVAMDVALEPSRRHDAAASLRDAAASLERVAPALAAFATRLDAAAAQLDR